MDLVLRCELKDRCPSLVSLDQLIDLWVPKPSLGLAVTVSTQPDLSAGLVAHIEVVLKGSNGLPVEIAIQQRVRRQAGEEPVHAFSIFSIRQRSDD